jgi:AAA domain
MAVAAQSYNWYEEPEVKTPWLVYGLIPADGYSSICGKPKAGKSTAVRNLIVSVIKGTPFLGRPIDLPGRVGRVLYLHLDRKDKPGRVSAQLKQLGLAEEDAASLTMRLAEHLPSKDYTERLKWLQEEVKASRPDLIVIDLMWQFVVAKNSNDYNAVLDGINDLQDALNQIGYKGALIAVMHGRKATNPNDQFDDFLGSTGQRGSFSTNIMLSQYRKAQLRIIASDQTDIDDRVGEIPETAIVRNLDGTLSLGLPVTELEKAEKKSKDEDDITKLLVFLENNPGVEIKTITDQLAMSKKRTLALLREVKDLISRTGEGIKGDPYLYFLKGSESVASSN